VIRDTIRFTYEELQLLDRWLGPYLITSGRGRRRELETIDQLYVLLLYLTSGLTFKLLSRELAVPESLVFRTVDRALGTLHDPIEKAMPKNLGECPEPTRRFTEFPQAFGIVDASPVYIRRPGKNQKKYYSGKYKRHCVKIQAFVNADGRCLHLSQVSKGAGHDKRLFDASGLTTFLEYREGQRIRHKAILADLGYCGIQTAIPEAILPYKNTRGGTLDEAKRDHNRLLSRDRILVENFFGRWKALFGVVAEEFRGSRGSLRKIVPITIGLTNWHIERHPLRVVEEERLTESDEEGCARPVEFVDSSSE
jgi:hypothetical protein